MQTPPVAIRVNGRLVGYIGARQNATHVKGAALEIERIKRLPPAQRRQAVQALRRGNPLTRSEIRQVAQLCSTEHGKHLRKKNPAGGCRPGETEIYTDVERVFAKKGPRSHAAGDQFVHRFKHAVACGCPDGSVVLRGRGGRRLWNLFRA